MSYQTARAKIVDVITGLTPVIKGLGVAERFSHDDKGTETRLGGPGRRFWLQVVDGGSFSPSPQWGRRTVTAQLVIEYPPTPAQTDELDLLVVSDYDVIARTLLDGSSWSRATSRILEIAGVGQGRVMPYRVEKQPQGVRLRITFSLTYDRAAVEEARIYAGAAVAGQTDVSALSGIEVPVYPITLSLSAGAGEYLWIAVPTAAGASTFTVDGFVGGFLLETAITVDGVAYSLWRSYAAALGSVTVEVSQ